MVLSMTTKKELLSHDKHIINIDETIDVLCSLERTKQLLIPLLETTVSAGFPSSAENYLEKALDLNDILVSHPASTFFIRVKGNSMINAGIKPNDILIVDRALSPTHNKIVIARINDELTVKRVKLEGEKLFLVPDSTDASQFKPLEITQEMDFEIWGVVAFVIHQV
jgi:DNA polymerase V